MRPALVTLALLVASQALALAPQPVRVLRAAAFLFEDEGYVATVRVEPRAENRLLIMGVWDEGSPIRMSRDDAVRIALEQLDGEDATVTREIRWRWMPVGEFEFRAYVFGSAGQLGMDSRRLTVLARR